MYKIASGIFQEQRNYFVCCVYMTDSVIILSVTCGTSEHGNLSANQYKC